MSAARQANSVFAQWYVNVANIWFVKSGKAIPKRLPIASVRWGSRVA